MNKSLYIFSLIGVAALAFISGIFWSKHELLDNSTFKLLKPLTLQTTPTATGELPVGTILYKYSNGNDIDTFIVFVNTKDLKYLESTKLDRLFTVAPLDGYSTK